MRSFFFTYKKTALFCLILASALFGLDQIILTLLPRDYSPPPLQYFINFDYRFNPQLSTFAVDFSLVNTPLIQKEANDSKKNLPQKFLLLTGDSSEFYRENLKFAEIISYQLQQKLSQYQVYNFTTVQKSSADLLVSLLQKPINHETIKEKEGTVIHFIPFNEAEFLLATTSGLINRGLKHPYFILDRHDELIHKGSFAQIPYFSQILLDIPTKSGLVKFFNIDPSTYITAKDIETISKIILAIKKNLTQHLNITKYIVIFQRPSTSRQFLSAYLRPKLEESFIYTLTFELEQQDNKNIEEYSHYFSNQIKEKIEQVEKDFIENK